MHFNYEYMVHFAEKYSRGNPEFTLLDFGCGAGEVVDAGLKRGLRIFGADIFYDEYYRNAITSAGLLGNHVREIKEGIIDFPDAFFDMVLSNQVFEHVEDLEGCLKEISRVLKPGGKMLCLFPSVDVWREGHCGVPFIHRFPKDSRFRNSYMISMRKLGFGKYKGEKTPEQWSRDFLGWIDRYCNYRDRKTIFKTFNHYFSIALIEDDYISERIAITKWGNFAPVAKIPMAKPIEKEVFRKLGGLVILASKPE